MGYERYPRNSNPQGDYYGRQDTQDEGRDHGSGRDYSYSSARDHAAAGGDRDRSAGRDRDDNRGDGRPRYGQGQRSGGSFGRDEDNHMRSGSDRPEYGNTGRRFGQEDHRRDPQGGQRDRARPENRGDDGRQPQGYDYDDRGFIARAGDEVRSWFGDEDAERRREMDSRGDDRYYQTREGADRDHDYHSWRSTQIAALDRDYDEYRNENRTKFHNEFSSWRTSRQGQRDSLSKVEEHMDVVGSDGEHVGTVDKVRGDRIILTKNDADAGGRHHSVPSRWIKSVEGKVTLDKSAQEAKAHWRDEERNQASFDEHRDQGGGDAQPRTADQNRRSEQQKGLNRSFSGTY